MDKSQIVHNGASRLQQVIRICVKALGLFVLINLWFAVGKPAASVGRISVYNWLVPGRQRLPYGDNPSRAYNLSLYNLDAMFSAHEISGRRKTEPEYRVLLIGDSSAWGYLLKPEETISAQMNHIQAHLPDGRLLRVYNAGYPVMSITKDLLILSKAMEYEPDAILWLFTLESLPYDKQLFPPLLQNNPELVKQLINTYQLNITPGVLRAPTFWDQTLLGQRRAIADWIRLQFYGMLWAATSIDQDIPSTYQPLQTDLSSDLSFHNLPSPPLHASDLALEVFVAGQRVAAGIPVWLVNEPMFISQGKNSHLRYNFYYPRWAYDDFRLIMATESLSRSWNYLDLWDYVSPGEFTNSAVHLSPAGAQLVAQRLIQMILETLGK